MSRKLLLLCGLMSSIVYLAMDVLGSRAWEGYSYVDQTVSELAALDAPSRSVAVPLAMVYNLLLIAFAAGVATSVARARDLRFAAAALAGIGIIGMISPFFPIQMRGAPSWTINETLHITLTAVTVVLIVVAMGLGARAGGPRFFVYSMASIAVTLLAGTIAAMNGPNLAANLPTPWMGVMERISIFAYLAWVATLAVVLMPAPRASMPLYLRGRHAGH